MEKVNQKREREREKDEDRWLLKDRINVTLPLFLSWFSLFVFFRYFSFYFTFGETFMMKEGKRGREWF